MPPKKRLSLRGKPCGHRPTTTAGQHLYSLHIDRIDVGPLLAVHLDGDVLCIQVSGDFLVLEGLLFHDMAPVAGRVANAQEHRPPQAPSSLKGLVPPSVPVHGIMRVLQQVWTGLEDQAVRVFRRAVRTKMTRSRLVVGALGGQRLSDERTSLRVQNRGTRSGGARVCLCGPGRCCITGESATGQDDGQECS